MSESDFRGFLVSLGLQPNRVEPDGRWHRCKTSTHPHKRNGSYKLALDGSVGFAQDHAAHQNAVVWRPGKDAPAAMPFDPAALARAHAEERLKRTAATQAAREFYARCGPLMDGHPYLAAHGLDMAGCSGLKIDADGWLVVPAYRERNLMTVQRISPTGEKRFWPGAPVKGAGFIVERRGAPITVLCEGLATGLAIFAAAPLTRILVAFNSGNMAEVAAPSSGLLAVASDNDHRTVCPRHKQEGLPLPFEPWAERPEWCTCNPGRHYAEKVAKARGCAYAEPRGLRGTDWSDFRSERLTERFEAREADPFSRVRDSDIRRAVDAEIAAAISRAARLPVSGHQSTLERR